jgi:microcystin-dependent protein
MADPFVAEIRIFGFNFAPTGWAQCNGQLLPISQNTALFSLVGTFYGGNGTSNFALPNIQGMGTISSGQGPGLTNRVQGETAGEINVTLLTSQLPAHAHTTLAKSTGTIADPGNSVFGEPANARPAPNFYATTQGTAVNMNALALTPVGGSQPHNNMMPYTVMNYCIAMQGVFPPRS